MTEIDSMIMDEIRYGSRSHRAPKRSFNPLKWLGVKIRPTGKHRG